MALFDFPVDYTDPTVRALRATLVQEFDTPLTARQMAQDAGLEIDWFPHHSTMRSIWHDFIREAAKRGQLERFVRQAASATGSARLREFLNGTPAIEPELPSGVSAAGWWHGKEESPKQRLERLMMKRARYVDLSVARSIAEIAGSVAKLEATLGQNRIHGTGFLIAPDLILTNYHNVCDENGNRATAIEMDFNYETGRAPLLRAGVDVVAGSFEDDWAVVKLNNSFDGTLIPLGTPLDIPLDSHLVIIQHPAGGPKQFTIDPFSVRYVDERVVQYTADTQKGSSGCPVFNTRMHAVALHHAEVEVEVRVGAEPSFEYRNEGIVMTRIIDALDTLGIAFTRRH